MSSYGELKALQTQTMTEIVRRFPRPEHILSKHFPEKTISGNLAAWDVVYGERKLAKFIPIGAEAHISPLGKRDRKTAEVLYIKEKKTLDEATINFIDKPGALNEPYGEQAIADELEGLDVKVENTCEWMRSQVLSGILQINQTDVKVNIDYGIQSTHKPNASTNWDVTASATPIKDIQNWKKLIQRDGWVDATDAYLNTTVMNYLLQNAAIQDLIKYRVGDSLAFTGTLTQLAGLALHEYDRGWLDDDDTTFKYFIPETKFVVVGGKLGSTYVAPARENGNAPGKFSRSWESDDPKNTWILVGVYELPVLTNPDQIVYANIG